MPWPHTRETAPRQPQGESPGDSPRSTDAHPIPTADTPPRLSKSQRKRDAHALQALGTQLVGLSAAHLARLALPDALREAVVAARGLRSHGARTRQMQYIGKLMRQLAPTALLLVQEALETVCAVAKRVDSRR
jgi:ribosome-associated protein